MNVYVRELSSALARTGVECSMFTRAWSPDLPAVVNVEPGLRVHHVAAGPLAPVAKEQLRSLVDEFKDGVAARMTGSLAGPTDLGYDAIHANYWLSGLAGHQLKHGLDLPLVSTFHTLDRVKAESSPEEVSSDEPRLPSRGRGGRSWAARRWCSPRAVSKPNSSSISTARIPSGSGSFLLESITHSSHRGIARKRGTPSGFQ